MAVSVWELARVWDRLGNVGWGVTMSQFGEDHNDRGDENEG